MVKMNYDLLPIKTHYFFLMAAMGPILPFLPVFGKQLGVSEVVMGSINAVLPILFLIIKPFFGYVIDFFHKRRKLIFMFMLMATSIFYFLMVFIPSSDNSKQISCRTLSVCNSSEVKTKACSWIDGNNSIKIHVDLKLHCISPKSVQCQRADETNLDKVICDNNESNFYFGFSFWAFTILMSLGTIGYNVSNCISDAICFDVLGVGQEMKYGTQRVWGTIGFGISALIGGFAMDYLNYGNAEGVKNYFPAFLLASFCMVIDILCCIKLKLPPLPKSENIISDIRSLIKQPHIVTFLIFATFVGICDSSLIFYLLWYLEDMAEATGYNTNIKLLEGLTVAVETLFGEVILFSYAGRILSKIGYGYCLSMCFGFYALRLLLVAIIPSPWWIIPVEMFMQGPTYALCYTTIVAYASAVAPPGTSGTIQGIVAGMDDGLGFSIGSIVGGIIYRIYGGRVMYGMTSLLALFCCITHTLLFYIFFKHSVEKPSTSVKLKSLDTEKQIEGVTELETSKFISG